MQAIFWNFMAVVVMVLLPIALVASIISHLRGKGSDRQGSDGISAGVGAALGELDRLLARPSVEYKIEVEHPTLEREDDTGGK